MAVFNADMERAAIATLEISSNDAVFEVGFGPGVGIRALARRLPLGFIAGGDPSRVMLEQASRRNGKAVRDDRVDLRLATASDLPWPDRQFDAVYSVNNVQEWPSLEADLAEVNRVLKPRGQLAIAVHEWVAKHAKDRGDPRNPWQDHMVAALDRGFSDVKAWKRRARSGRALYFFAHSTS